MSDNGLGEDGGVELASNLKHLTALEYLDLNRMSVHPISLPTLLAWTLSSTLPCHIWPNDGFLSQRAQHKGIETVA